MKANRSFINKNIRLAQTGTRAKQTTEKFQCHFCVYTFFIILDLFRQ